MNQDQVKELLLQIDDSVEEFSLIFSGKTSKKANGVYHPDTREIIIHNRNFESDTGLIYTAIHEFAHHVHYTTSAIPVGPRAHTREFRSILHRLLIRAERLGVYASPFEADPEFKDLTSRIRTQFLARNGELMKQFGAALVEAEQLCSRRGARFEDYVERVLLMDRSTASTIMKMHAYDVDPSIGYQNMATVVSYPNQAARVEAQEAFRAGESPDMVKTARKTQQEAPDPVSQLERERHRIERTIRSLESRLHEIEAKIDALAT